MKISGIPQPSRAGAVSLLGVSALLLFAGSASANTFRPTAPDGLEAAVASANSNPGPDTILLNNTQTAAQSTYQPLLPMTITGDLTISKSRPRGSGQRAVINGGSVNPAQADLFTVNPAVNVTFDSVVIQTASDAGFAVIHNFGNLTVNRSGLTGNSGNDLNNEDGGTATFNNSTVSDNAVSAAANNAGTLTYNNSSVYREAGGGISSTGPLNLNNTVVAENVPNCFAPATSTVASLDDDQSCGVQFSGVNPQLGPTQNNGGPSGTARPAATSPVINQGSNTICPTVDQRYFVRSDGLCDIGAFEVGSAADTTAPTCVVSATRNGPPRQQDVTAQDTGSGLDAGDPPGTTNDPPGGISNVVITNGTVSYTPFGFPSRSPLVLTASKTTAGTPTQWSFTATDLSGNTKACR